MQKIISLFQRNYETDRLVRDEAVPGAEWVLDGEGVPTRKYDGTCCMIQDGVLYKRYDAKHGKKPPTGFIPAQDPDPVTGHWPGWIATSDDSPQDRWHREAWNSGGMFLPDGTYELIGPKIQGNAEHQTVHRLIRHGVNILPDFPRTFDGIRAFLMEFMIEGIVFYHPDGRMVKIKRKDFGLPWPIKNKE